MSTASTSLPGNDRIHTPKSAVFGILAVSAVASAFLFWLVYYHPPIDTNHTRFLFLPALNAVLNALAAVLFLFHHPFQTVV